MVVVDDGDVPLEDRALVGRAGEDQGDPQVPLAPTLFSIAFLLTRPND